MIFVFYPYLIFSSTLENSKFSNAPDSDHTQSVEMFSLYSLRNLSLLPKANLNTKKIIAERKNQLRQDNQEITPLKKKRGHEENDKLIQMMRQITPEFSPVNSKRLKMEQDVMPINLNKSDFDLL